MGGGENLFDPLINMFGREKGGLIGLEGMGSLYTRQRVAALRAILFMSQM